MPHTQVVDQDVKRQQINCKIQKRACRKSIAISWKPTFWPASLRDVPGMTSAYLRLFRHQRVEVASLGQVEVDPPRLRGCSGPRLSKGSPTRLGSFRPIVLYSYRI